MTFVLQAALALAELDDKLVGPPIPDDRIFDCVNVILSFQNTDGGWSTYENTRSYPVLEVRFPPPCFVSPWVSPPAAVKGLAQLR